MADTRYPYKIRCMFTARQEAGLRAASDRYETPILEVVRRYVAEGLARDGITGGPAPACEGQTTIPVEDTEGEQ